MRSERVGAVAAAISAVTIGLVSSAFVFAAEPVRIALVTDDTVAAMHAESGFRIGLGSGTVAGHRFEIIPVAAGDDPAARLRSAYAEGKADLGVSLVGSAATLAMLPEAAAARRVMLVASASDDAITGAAGNRYVFRTAASDAEVALAAIQAFARPQQNLMAAALDAADGRGAAASFKAQLERRQSGTFFIGLWLLPPDGSGLADAAAAQYDGLHNLHEARTLVVLGQPSDAVLAPLIAADPGHYGVKLALAGPLDPVAPPVAIDGVTPYHPALVKNPLNDHLIAAWQARFHAQPDGAAADGMSAALAVCAGLASGTSADGEALVKALEGLRFASPKGEIVVRKEDHQAVQSIYQYNAAPASGGVTLSREFSPAELALPLPTSGG